MIVYGHDRYRLNLVEFIPDFLGRLDRAAVAPARDTLVDLFVDFGEAYAAVADALMRFHDDVCVPLTPWSAVMQRLATALAAHRCGDGEGARAALATAARRGVDLEPTTEGMKHVNAGKAEGFAYFALHPDQYLQAARDLLRTMNPAVLTCVGLRGIGAPLAHLIAAEAERSGIEYHVVSVRPRGHPFDRRLEITPALRRKLERICVDVVAIVDEGPGLSGSSFAAAAETITSLGVRSEQIVLVPSWNAPEAALRSDRGRETFRRHRSFVGQCDTVEPPRGWIDIGAGQWRVRVFGAEEHRWPAVHPQHERRKHLSPGARVVRRFAGLGRYGRAAYERAATLATSGFVAPPESLADGFLEQPWIKATPLSMSVPRPSQLDAIAQYVAFVSRAFATGRAARVDDLMDMAARNGGVRCAKSTLDAPEIAVDGRMLPHEWLSAGQHLFKADSLDHHDDDFFPGSRDIAWDVAGMIAEFNLRPAAASRFVDRYAAASGDRTIAQRLPFYQCVYLCYRIGYASLAAETLIGTGDGVRFTRLAERYRRSLESHVPNRPLGQTW